MRVLIILYQVVPRTCLRSIADGGGGKANFPDVQKGSSRCCREHTKWLCLHSVPSVVHALTTHKWTSLLTYAVFLSSHAS